MLMMCSFIIIFYNDTYLSKNIFKTTPLFALLNQSSDDKNNQYPTTKIVKSLHKKEFPSSQINLFALQISPFIPMEKAICGKTTYLSNPKVTTIQHNIALQQKDLSFPSKVN